MAKVRLALGEAAQAWLPLEPPSGHSGSRDILTLSEDLVSPDSQLVVGGEGIL